MCLIDVLNFKEIDLWEGYFYVVQKVFKSGVKKKKKGKKNGQFLEVCVLFTTDLISFKFHM